MLSVIIRRIRGDSGTVPLVRAYDRRECLWIGPAPLLFQRRFGPDNRRICDSTIRNMLNAALAGTGLADHADGSPLHYSPHDFRRIFITDAIMSGLPPHIAQIIAGHQDLNVTMGYKAVYPDEAIQAHLAFLARRRALRPSEEYRDPHRRGMDRVPRPFRAPQGRHRHLRPRVRHPVHPRAQLPALQHALALARPAAPHRRDPRQPHRPHRRSRTRRLARRSRRTQDQPGRAPATSSPRSTGAPHPPALSPSACPPSPPESHTPADR